MASAPKVEDLVRQAPFVFVGAVVKLQASTVASYSVKAGTAIVKVSRMLRTPEVVGDLSGREITVQLSDPKGAKAGDEAIFYARGIVYAESIVVEEIFPHQKVAPSTKAKSVQQVTEAANKLPDLHVQAHAAEVDLVIVGKVIAIKLVDAPQGPITHHDPGWQEATVAVESVEVGRFDQKTIAFLFPSTTDVKWHKAPKFSVGMEGMFLLHRREVAELKREAHVVLDPMDFHPLHRVQAIRKLLRAQVAPKAVPPKPAPPTNPKRGKKR